MILAFITRLFRDACLRGVAQACEELELTAEADETPPLEQLKARMHQIASAGPEKKQKAAK